MPKKPAPVKPTTESGYDRKIIFALRRIMQQMDVHSRGLMKHHDITVAQIVTLYEIVEKGVTTISILSKNVHLSNSTLVGVIDRLEEKGLVKRTRDTKDRRTVFVEGTKKGKAFVVTSPHLLHNKLDKKLKALSRRKQLAIAHSLNLLVNMLEESNA